MASWVTTLSVLSAFGAAYSASIFVDRMLNRKMGNSMRGTFTFVVGIFLLVGLVLVSLAPCLIFGKACSDS